VNKETRLAIEYAKGLSDGTELIKQFDDLIRKIVISRWNYSPENNFDDLHQEGRIAVLDTAANRFDVNYNTEFSTFVFHRITHAVNKAGPGSLGGAVVPWTTLNKYRQAMRATDGDPVEAQAWAVAEGTMSAQTFIEVHNALSPVDPEHIPNVPDVAEQVASADLVDRILEGLEPGQERTLFAMFYGVEDGIPRTAKELAELTGRDAQDIRNELAKSRRKLRGQMNQTDY